MKYYFILIFAVLICTALFMLITSIIDTLYERTEQGKRDLKKIRELSARGIYVAKRDNDSMKAIMMIYKVCVFLLLFPFLIIFEVAKRTK